MAQKRMFSLLVTDTDVFLDLPTSAQALYFHLGMHGDDDGFVGSPRKIMRAVGCNADDLNLLSAKGFIIPFRSGIVVIRDWNVNNTLKNDRYHPTIYQAEKALLSSDESGKYLLSEAEPSWNQVGTKLEPEQNITQRNVTQQNLEGAGKPPRSRFIPPTVEEVRAYCAERGNTIDAQIFVDFYDANGWMRGKNHIKDWRACVRTWEAREKNARDIHSPARYCYEEGESL